MSVSRIRVPLGFIVAAIVLYLARPTPGLIAAGLPFLALGLVFRGTAAGVIHKDRRLAAHGPYRFTRNPLYFGSFLLVVGFAITSGHWLPALLLVVPFAAIYPPVIRREEAHLKQLFGEEFQRFRESTPAFFPRRIGSDLIGSFSWVQYRANGEYNAALGTLGALVLLWLKTLGIQ